MREMVTIQHCWRSIGRSIPSWPATRIAIAAAALAAGPAGAEPAPDQSVASSAIADPGAAMSLTIDGSAGRRIAVDTPREMFSTPFAQIAPILYLNRCTGGCAVHSGANDARTDTSSIPSPGPGAPGTNNTYALTEFASSLGKVGALADDEWGQLLQCMKEVYSPYNIAVTDVRPGSGQSFHEAFVAGQPGEVGLSSDVLGVAPLANDCSAIDNVISFSFANHHATPSGLDGPHLRALSICWTAAQESAHAYGLDHEYSFVDGSSACRDPMTYRTDCGGQKFFRNVAANCGENSVRACRCGASQNSHLKIQSVFGQATPITGAPTVALTDPATGGGLLGRGVSLQAGAQRGVDHVDLYFNGFKWAEAPGAAFGSSGQPDPANYTVLVPSSLPNSIVDVKVIAYDDLGTATESGVVTVTKGAACTSAAGCATGQKCEAGKCFWDPAVGEIGERCTYSQYCKSGLCTGTAEQQICTQACVPGSADSCPDGLSCTAQSASTGVCFFSSSAGCCSVDHGDSPWWLHGAVSALVLGAMLRRRRPGLRSQSPRDHDSA
jgi:hypothetical protein